MADSNTPTYSLVKPEVDGSDGTWGLKLNNNLDSLDSLLSGGTQLQNIHLTGQVELTNSTGTSGQVLTSAGSGANAYWSSVEGIALTDLSVTVGSVGTANLAYNSGTGVFTYTPPDLSAYLTASSTATLTNKSGNISQWTNDSGYGTSSFSGAYADLTGKPALFSGVYDDLTGKPTLFSGAYADLTGKPTIPTNNNELTNGAGYTTNIGDITAVVAGTALSGGATSGSATLDVTDNGIGATQLNVTGNGTSGQVLSSDGDGSFSWVAQPDLSGYYPTSNPNGYTDDQTAGEIKTAYESNADTNAYTDSEKTKLSGIETNATGDQTASEIKTAYESNANTNAYTDAEKSNLAGVQSALDGKVDDSQVLTNVPAGAVFTDTTYSAGTGVSLVGTTFNIGQDVATTSGVTFGAVTVTGNLSVGSSLFSDDITATNIQASGNLNVSGDLTVNGTTTTLKTANLDVEDKNITLNYGAGDTSASANGAGITIQDAVNSTTDATILWDATNDEFDFSHNVTAPNLNVTNWNTAYSWGNHATAGYLTSFTEADPTVPAHVKAISTTNISNWNTAYSYSQVGHLPLSGGTLTGNVDFNDGVRARFGASDDLQIYHTGTLSYIQDTGTGSLNIETNGTHINLRGGAGNNDMAKFQSGGGVQLFHSGSEKLEVTSTGIDVTGTVVATGGNSTNWNTAYGWGNHATAGYYPASNPNGYTNDQTAAEILTAIKTVDGSGSGLDADLLDGQHGSYYYPASNPNGYTSSVGDITNVNAGTGLSGGGASGSVTLNLSNTMAPAVATELSSSVDLDTLNGSAAGFYYQTANSDTAGNNYPNGHAGSLIVQKSAGNATQIYQTYSTSPELFFRSNYTAGYTAWRKVWHDGNDGSGSGLDADLLDGQHGSAYLRSNASATNSVDLRAPVFYDSNNTSYYVNPASTSVLNNLQLNGVLNTGTNSLVLQRNGSNVLSAVDGATYLYPGGSSTVALTLQSGRTIAPILSIGQVNNYVDVIDSSRNLKNVNSLQFSDTSPTLSENGNYLRIQTASGLIDIGSGNSGWGHFNTDRAKFYFSKPVHAVDGFTVYNTNTRLISTGAYAPAFYDSDNSGNYLDSPTSSIFRLNSSSIVHLSVNGSAKLVADASGIDVTGTATADVLESTGGSYSALTDSVTDAGLVVTNNQPIYSLCNGGNHLRNIIKHDGSNNIVIGQSGTGLINNIDLYTGTSGIVKFYTAGLQAQITSAGTVDARSFRDLDNTAFYVDPANTSTVKNFVFNSGTTLTQSTPNIESRASNNTAGNTHYHATFCRNNGTVNGKITTNYYATTYSTTSDYRVKEDIQPMGSATADLMALNPVNFQWVGSDMRADGFLAHEVSGIVPDAVVGDKDAVDTKGNPDLQGLDQSKMVPLLVKTIQEQQAVIESLEARLIALENA